MIFCIYLVQAEGFSPLAARPAPTLLTSSFADEFSVVLVSQGKAFRSRKTAPTLESLSKYGKQKNMGITTVIPIFLARREGFEPPEALTSTVFKTAVIDHSTISAFSYITLFNSFIILYPK